MFCNISIRHRDGYVKNHNLIAMATTITTRKDLINPSPFFTENLLATHAPVPFPIAKTKPTNQTTLSFKTKTTKADIIYVKTTTTLVALALTKVILFTKFRNNNIKKPIYKTAINTKKEKYNDPQP